MKFDKIIESALVEEGKKEKKINPRSSYEFRNAFAELLDTYHGLSEEQQIREIKEILTLFDTRVDWAWE